MNPPDVEKTAALLEPSLGLSRDLRSEAISFEIWACVKQRQQHLTVCCNKDANQPSGRVTLVHI